MSITRKRYFDHTVTIDEQPIRLCLKRMTVPEFEEFRAMFAALAQKRGAPSTLGTDGASATIDDIRAEAAYLKANAEWQQGVFEAYVTVCAGDVVDQDADGTLVPVTNGRHFAEMFHGEGVIADVLAELYVSNVLTDQQKKTLRLRSGLATGSLGAASPVTPGETPEPTAATAASLNSVSDADVMAPISDTSSGTTDRSSSEAVPCAI